MLKQVVTPGEGDDEAEPGGMLAGEQEWTEMLKNMGVTKYKESAKVLFQRNITLNQLLDSKEWSKMNLEFNITDYFFFYF